MAKGSEQFSWLHNWPHQRTCDTCGKELRVKDVGEHRTYYEGGKPVRNLLWCWPCVKEGLSRHA